MSGDLKDSRCSKSYFPWCHELLSYHILCIGGLETSGSVKTLKKYLSLYGKIVWIRVFPNVQSSGGFAHVILDRPESYHLLFSKSVHYYEGVNIRIKMWRKPCDGSSYDSKINERKVFVKNLAPFITEKHLFDYFSKFGQIEAIEIPASSFNEATRKIGYITLLTKQSAEEVLATPNHIIRKNKVKCRKYCTENKDRDPRASITIPNQPPGDTEEGNPRGIAGLPNINLYKVFKRGKKKFLNMLMGPEEEESLPDSESVTSVKDPKHPSPLSTNNSIPTLRKNEVKAVEASPFGSTLNNPIPDDSQSRDQDPEAPGLSLDLGYLRRPLFVQYYTVIENF